MEGVLPRQRLSPVKPFRSKHDCCLNFTTQKPLPFAYFLMDLHENLDLDGSHSLLPVVLKAKDLIELKIFDILFGCLPVKLAAVGHRY